MKSSARARTPLVPGVHDQCQIYFDGSLANMRSQAPSTLKATGTFSAASCATHATVYHATFLSTKARRANSI
jgi:hypothetical protein